MIAGFVGVIGVCYLAELFYAHPPLGTVAQHSVMPEFAGSESVLLAVGILGATVMPHVIYLHSALTQNRIVPRNDAEARRLFRYTKVDVVIAMSIAGLINMAMLVVAASVFYESRASSTSTRSRPRTRRSSRSSAAPRARSSRWRCSPRGCRARPSARSPARS